MLFDANIDLVFSPKRSQQNLGIDARSITMTQVHISEGKTFVVASINFGFSKAFKKRNPGIDAQKMHVAAFTSRSFLSEIKI